MKYICWHCGVEKVNPTGLCLTCGKFPSTMHGKYVTLAYNLSKEQSISNNGRGISCVRTIITYLNLADINSAKAVCRNEGDKICNYPKIVELLKVITD